MTNGNGSSKQNGDHQLGQSHRIDNGNRHVYVDTSFTRDIERIAGKLAGSHKRDYSLPQLISNSLAALAAVIATVLVAWQGCLLKKSNEINRQALESVQRAFVTLADIDTRPSSYRDEYFWVFTPVFENNGATTAIESATYFVGKKMEREPSQQDFIGVQENGIARVDLGPKVRWGGASLRVRFNDVFNLSEYRGDLSVLENSTVNTKYFVWGWTTYRDILPATPIHVTEFCQHLSAYQTVPGKDPNGPREFRFVWAPCTKHNCTDERCDDYGQLAAHHAETKR